MMEAKVVVLFCALASAARTASPSNQCKLQLNFDRPSFRRAVSQEVLMQCCHPCEVKVTWIQTVMLKNSSSSKAVDLTSRMEITEERKHNMNCSNLKIINVELNDTGLYQCNLTQSNSTVQTPGTFLQVYTPVQMILNFNERTKNSIITAQGVLLLLVVLIPGTLLICKSKGLHELEKRKNKEEENIYEGLNLDDCNSTYHQIQRSLVQGPYQDVCNNDEDDIQLEKP